MTAQRTNDGWRRSDDAEMVKLRAQVRTAMAAEAAAQQEIAALRADFAEVAAGNTNGHSKPNERQKLLAGYHMQVQYRYYPLRRYYYGRQQLEFDPLL